MSQLTVSQMNKRWMFTWSPPARATECSVWNPVPCRPRTSMFIHFPSRFWKSLKAKSPELATSRLSSVQGCCWLQRVIWPVKNLVVLPRCFDITADNSCEDDAGSANNVGGMDGAGSALLGDVGPRSLGSGSSSASLSLVSLSIASICSLIYTLTKRWWSFSRICHSVLIGCVLCQ
jgi:hypothetical protein